MLGIQMLNDDDGGFDVAWKMLEQVGHGRQAASRGADADHGEQRRRRCRGLLRDL